MRAALEELDVEGLEFGRVLVLGTYVDHNQRRRDQLRFELECSCGFRFSGSARKVMSGRYSMCRRCYAIFKEKYGVAPEREWITLDVIQQMIAERDAEKYQYEKAKEKLGL